MLVTLHTPSFDGVGDALGAAKAKVAKLKSGDNGGHGMEGKVTIDGKTFDLGPEGASKFHQWAAKVKPTDNIMIDGNNVPVSAPEAKAYLMQTELQMQGIDPTVAHDLAYQAFGVKAAAKVAQPDTNKPADTGKPTNQGKGWDTSGKPTEGKPADQMKPNAGKAGAKAGKGFRGRGGPGRG